MKRAILRDVADTLATYGSDAARAREQHAAYAAALTQDGVETIVMEADPALADCCFIEDNAVLHGGRALLTSMGAPWRRAETAAVGKRLASLGFDVVEMGPPATLEGGDVLRTARRAFVGLSTRTNEAGVRVLQEFLGAECVPVLVADCIHLKTACTEAAEGVLVLNPRWVDRSAFADHEIIEVEGGANTLQLNGTCLVSAAHPETAALLRERAIAVTSLDISEFEKAEGGLTCLLLPCFDP